MRYFYDLLRDIHALPTETHKRRYFLIFIKPQNHFLVGINSNGSKRENKKHSKKNATWLLQIMRPDSAQHTQKKTLGYCKSCDLQKNEFQLDLQQNSAQMLKHAHTLFSCGRIHAARGRLSFAHVLR